MTGRRTFAGTWWGKAWIEALESRARLDPNRLPRGRTYARHDHVLDMTVEPGMLRAVVAGRRPTPYRVTVRIRTFDGAEWERLLGAIASKAAHAAALLDGDLEPGIVADAAAAGVELFPTAGELVPRCSCPDWADPCKHSAAVCYLMADRLDADPFNLLLLRGKGREEVLASLRALRAAAAPPAEQAARQSKPSTMTARDAWRRVPGDLPAVPPPPRRAARPAPWPVDPPLGSGLDAAGLAALAADAVVRAWAMAVGEGRSGLDLDEAADLARRADAAMGTPHWQDLVIRSGLDGRELARRAMAFRAGGAAGVKAASEAPWTPGARVMAEARERLVDAGIAPTRLHVDRNAIVWGDERVRLGHDGRWWPFTKQSGRWELAGPPVDEVDDLLSSQ